MTKRQQKQVVSLAIAIISAVITIGHQEGWFKTLAEPAVQQQSGFYTISRFIDGDTLNIDLNGTKETIRLIGVDTPETHYPNRPVQCYGPAASTYLKNLTDSQQVRLSTDQLSANRDRYKRLLRYAYLPDGRLINLELIKNGYGFAYTSFPFTMSDEFSAAHAKARIEQKGLWSNCTPFQQANGQWQTNDQIK